MPLPIEILRSRLANEVMACERGSRTTMRLSDPEMVVFPVSIEVGLPKVPGPVLEGEKVVYRYDHRFRMIITKNYPFEKPMIIWLTPIFHPNIMMPEDGGYLCNKLLDDWNFNSTLLMFIKGIEFLLLNPNSSSPFGTETCTAAAQYFNTIKRVQSPIATVPLPKVVSRS